MSTVLVLALLMVYVVGASVALRMSFLGRRDG